MASGKRGKLVLLSLLFLVLAAICISGFPTVPKPDFSNSNTGNISSNTQNTSFPSVTTTVSQPSDPELGALSASFSEMNQKLDEQAQKIDVISESMVTLLEKQADTSSMLNLLVIGMITAAALLIALIIIVIATRTGKKPKSIETKYDYTYPRQSQPYPEQQYLASSAAASSSHQNLEQDKYSWQIYNYYSTYLARGYKAEMIIDQLVHAGCPRSKVLEIIEKYKRQNLVQR
jgi:hypothetical protein